MELTSGVTLSAGRSGGKARARATRAVAGLGRVSRAERACWASAVEGRSGRQLGRGGEQPTREREGVGGLCGSEPSGVSWAEHES